MDDFKSLKPAIFELEPGEFEPFALKVFRLQATGNEVYRDYLHYLNIDINSITDISDIPFLPIQFFKNHKVVTGNWPVQTIFESSGTTGQSRGQHYIEDRHYYHKNSQAIFENRFGTLDRYHIIALLPSYLERTHSSLIEMVNYFMDVSNSSYSGFYLYDQQEVIKKLQELAKLQSRKILLWGVSFALLDLAEKYELDLSKALIISTGGMKGRREEITNIELNNYVKKRWNVPIIHAEYGMTELMSQAYTFEEYIYRPPSWMRVLIRETNDPFEYCPYGKSGVVNVIDLANLHSCAFIATDDLGVAHKDGFEIFGRLDNSDMRGCNLMLSDISG